MVYLCRYPGLGILNAETLFRWNFAILLILNIYVALSIQS